MNIVNSGNNFVIYGEDIQTYKELPANTYRVCFDMTKGFSLGLHDDLCVNEKVYGRYPKKVGKVMNTFKNFNRNLGIILSGPKGSGKTVFARLLAEEGKKVGMPLIIVDRPYDGVENFISSIKQECIVLFDEFDKVFNNRYSTQQDHLLSLFDGIDNGKKMYVITCNDLRFINRYFFNRPGRFHYHFVFTSPSGEEVREYLNDNLSDNAKQYADRLEGLSLFSDFTYDILRAIVYELNNGYTLDETLEDLNIQYSSDICIGMNLEFSNGMKAHLSGGKVNINLKRYDYRFVYDIDKETIPEIMRDICVGVGEDIDDVDVIATFKVSDLKITSTGFKLDPENVPCHLRCSPSQLDDYFKTVKLTKVDIIKDDLESPEFIGGLKMMPGIFESSSEE